MDDPRLQNFTIQTAWGENVTIPMGLVDAKHRYGVNLCSSYGTQIGASIMMLLVFLVMNPAAKLMRTYTAVQVAALAVNIVRMVLLCLFWPSQWKTFYAVFAGDYQFVPRGDYAISVAANVSSLTLTILVELCLVMQAWTMMNLWNDLWKWLAAASSAILSLVTIGFRFAFCVLQSKAILDTTSAQPIEWVAKTSMTIGAVSIFWYCGLFNVQLIIHLVKNRRFLPRMAGLSPMEALAFANGIIMFVPAVFAGLQWLDATEFEAGSLMLTSVVVILPLGTLVAHRLTAIRSYNLSDGSGSGWNSKPSATRTSVTSSNPRSRLMTHVEAPTGRQNSDDLELYGHTQSLDSASGVRVHRNLNQTVEHTPRQF